MDARTDVPEVVAPESQRWFDLQVIENELQEARYVLARLKVERLLNLDPENDETIQQAIDRVEANIELLLREHQGV